MLVFGIDIPLIEVIFGLVLVSFIILAEIVVVVILLMKNLSRTKEMAELLNKLSNVLLEVKREEMKEIEKLKNN